MRRLQALLLLEEFRYDAAVPTFRIPKLFGSLNNYCNTIKKRHLLSFSSGSNEMSNVL
jgi:hypothetical protein